MKISLCRSVGCFVIFLAINTLATVHYVALNSTNATPPYTDWSNAATNIQDAIDASAIGDTVLVTNGIYAAGGKSMDGIITNRVSVDKVMVVQSVNGPSVTVIRGALDPTSTNGPAAVRCAWLTNNATLTGFTICGGATRVIGANGYTACGGGVFGGSVSATVSNCVIASNYACLLGGGAFQVTMNNCSLIGNRAVGSGMPNTGAAGAGSGGGAAICNLGNCFIIANLAEQGNGGGVSFCHLTNCSLTLNSCYVNGGAVDGGSLLNCTVMKNTSFGYEPGYGAAVYGAALTNTIVWGNFGAASYSSTNYANSTLVYCCSYPLATGVGNIAIDPQLLADGLHLSETSPCIGTGTNLATGTDIEGHPWNNPPSIGCDEWQPSPIIAVQPSIEVNRPMHGLNLSVLVAGQTPLTYFWSQNGAPIQNDGHFSNANTANLLVNNFGLSDAGAYQVMVSNAVGVVTSQVASVVIHTVNVAAIDPVAPYESWATAATNIQDAIEAASPGDIVLVTNGTYDTGGKVMAGGLTNRIALDKVLTVVSVDGYADTVIKGAWDPVTTNGPAAVRCAWLTNGAVLIGFTLEHGATLNTGNNIFLQSGGGVWCASSNALVSNCLLSNNFANYAGGGISSGTLNNSLVVLNVAASQGGGAFGANLYNCSVENNFLVAPFPSSGAGTAGGFIQNSIVLNNFDGYPSPLSIDNFWSTGGLAPYYYCCTANFEDRFPMGPGNIDVDPLFLDSYHISINSPCLGAGSALYASGTDLDGEPWNDPPSIGCDEVIVSNRIGLLSVTMVPFETNVLVSSEAVPHVDSFFGTITGLATYLSWNFGDGPAISNADSTTSHSWTNVGDYTVVFTAYNVDNPIGVSISQVIHVSPLSSPQLQPPVISSNTVQFQFAMQEGASYFVQYATNLSPPVTWTTLQSIYDNFGGTMTVQDAATNTTRFYRVLAQ